MKQPTTHPEGLRSSSPPTCLQARFLPGIVVLALALSPFAVPAAEPEAKAPIVQAANGTVQLPARQVTIHGTTVRYEPQPHKNTVGYWTKAEDWVSWDFKLTQPGTFSVVVTQACGKGSGGSEYRLAVGDQTLTDVVPDTGAFTNFVERVIGSVTLGKAGDYTLSVTPLKKPGLAVMDLRMVTLKLKKPGDKPAPSIEAR